MTLILRRSSAQARIEGWDPRIWPDDDYAIVDTDIPVGRIYHEVVCGDPKWRWSIHQIPEAGPGRPITPPHNGIANTLDDAKTAFKARYQQLRERFQQPGSTCAPSPRCPV
jgi:hypothetical protein